MARRQGQGILLHMQLIQVGLGFPRAALFRQATVVSPQGNVNSTPAPRQLTLRDGFSMKRKLAGHLQGLLSPVTVESLVQTTPFGG
jgi:hypothetical protein